MEPIGSAWIRFGIVYYLYALIFLAFDVDVLFLFPVAVAYNSPGLGLQDFYENPVVCRHSFISHCLCLA